MPDLIKVAKFGGTSMADAAAMRRCAAIVHSDPDKKILVVSATSGTTNLLTEFASDVSSIRRVEIAKQIADKHYAICEEDRKSTRLNSSHVAISYAVFCLKKKAKVLTETCTHELHK